MSHARKAYVGGGLPSQLYRSALGLEKGPVLTAGVDIADAVEIARVHRPLVHGTVPFGVTILHFHIESDKGENCVVGERAQRAIVHG